MRTFYYLQQTFNKFTVQGKLAANLRTDWDNLKVTVKRIEANYEIKISTKKFSNWKGIVKTSNTEFPKDVLLYKENLPGKCFW